MTLSDITFLSIVQGLTEFLPVSSSGHLVVFPRLLGIEDQGILMDLAVHVGTLMAVLVYYFKDLFLMAKSMVLFNNQELRYERALSIYIIIATIPAMVIGYITHVVFPDGIRDERVIIFTLAFFGIFMILAEKFSKNNRQLAGIDLKTALIVGFAQVLAFIPGTSRSGITITAARFLGYNHTDSAKFSFLLSVPAIAGAGLLGAVDFYKNGNFEEGLQLLTAISISFAAGLLSIAFMMRFLKKIGLIPFAIYRIILAIALVFIAL